MRGQAFVVFREVGEAASAKNNLNGYPIFGKSMVDEALSVENHLRRQPQQSRRLRRKVIHTSLIGHHHSLYIITPHLRFSPLSFVQ